MVRGGQADRTVRRAKIFALAKGFRGRSKNCYSIAVRRVQKALQYQYVSRRLKKREMRSLWISRINMATREHNVTYSKFVNQMAQCNIQLNRKVLSDLAIHEPRSFKALAELAKSRHKDGLLAAIRWHSLLSGKSVCAILLLGVATFSPHIGRAATLRIYPFWF